jgi:hypothetical protein
MVIRDVSQMQITKYKKNAHSTGLCGGVCPHQLENHLR